MYTGNVFVDRFPPGPVSPDSEPVSLPVQIVQGPAAGATALGPEFRVIEDFGTVPIDGDRTFKSSVSFDAAGGEGSGGDDEEGETVTATFELTVEGEPPEGFDGFNGVVGTYVTEGELLDGDGDGVYTASLPVERGTEQEVRIECLDLLDSGLGATTTIRDFGTVTFDEDKTLRARINFGRDRGETTTPGPVTGGSDNSDSPGSGGAGSSGSSGNSDSDSSGNSGGSGSSGGSADSGSGGSGGSGILSGAASGMKGLLPSTGGGVTLAVLGAGILLILGGLLVRRIFR